ncbi:MAG: hypothetical protein NTW25_13265 [Candidatus Kapabacteria bacterium]|jgi:hypothetical protein|nr:hypothetical protein [Candidatus Kapabacteria bacterium]
MKELRILNYFMIEIKLPELIDENFLIQLPRHREYVNQLMREGTISTYTLSADRSKLWCVALGASVQEVNTLMNTFPLSKYMQFTINELAFHNNTVHRMPELSMN